MEKRVGDGTRREGGKIETRFGTTHALGECHKLALPAMSSD